MNGSTGRWTDRMAAPQAVAVYSRPPADITRRTAEIYRHMLAESPAMRAGNFQSIAASDLERLFERYDASFFEGRLRRLLAEQAGGRLTFRLSRRMTSSGGTTTRWIRDDEEDGGGKHARFEIAISTTLLFQSFGDLERPVRVNGLSCRDRLEALQRVFEHELLHLLELLTTNRTNCSADDFRRLARGVFAHTEVTHELVTQRERAAAQLSVRVGDRVQFDYQGRRHVGVLNRITRRATVLVEQPGGVKYSDGRRYVKFYIPLALLQKA